MQQNKDLGLLEVRSHYPFMAYSATSLEHRKENKDFVTCFSTLVSMLM